MHGRHLSNISATAPEAEPVAAATVHQCVGSATTGTPHCSPFPAVTTGATVTQCDGSGNAGAAATVVCTVEPSEVSRAIPITVNQCNGTGNAGASTVTCSTIIRTNVVPVVVTSPSVSGRPLTVRFWPADDVGIRTADDIRTPQDVRVGSTDGPAHGHRDRLTAAAPDQPPLERHAADADADAVGVGQLDAGTVGIADSTGHSDALRWRRHRQLSQRGPSPVTPSSSSRATSR